jgi:hypothetical protein
VGWAYSYVDVCIAVYIGSALVKSEFPRRECQTKTLTILKMKVSKNPGQQEFSPRQFGRWPLHREYYRTMKVNREVVNP